MVEVKPLLSPEDVEVMYDRGEIDPERRFELVDGELVYLTAPLNKDHGRIGALIIRVLGSFADEIGAWLFDGSQLYRVGAQSRNLRLPDVSLVTKERMNIFPEPDGWAREAPDLAVEILSQDQYTDAYARPKVTEYLAAGAKVVWLVDPQNRTVRAYEPGRTDYTVYSGNAEITLDRIAPGFRAPVSNFFPKA